MRNTARSRTMARMVLALCAGFGAATAATNGACTQTSQYVQKACQAGAQSDYQTSLGKCINIGVSGQRKRCQQDAASELAEALDLCDAQDDARDAVCARLGQAPYDPRVDPSNFVRHHAVPSRVPLQSHSSVPSRAATAPDPSTLQRRRSAKSSWNRSRSDASVVAQEQRSRRRPTIRITLSSRRFAPAGG